MFVVVDVVSMPSTLPFPLGNVCGCGRGLHAINIAFLPGQCLWLWTWSPCHQHCLFPLGNVCGCGRGLHAINIAFSPWAMFVVVDVVSMPSTLPFPPGQCLWLWSPCHQHCLSPWAMFVVVDVVSMPSTLPFPPGQCLWLWTWSPCHQHCLFPLGNVCGCGRGLHAINIAFSPWAMPGNSAGFI